MYLYILGFLVLWFSGFCLSVLRYVPVCTYLGFWFYGFLSVLLYVPVCTYLGFRFHGFQAFVLVFTVSVVCF